MVVQHQTGQDLERGLSRLCGPNDHTLGRLIGEGVDGQDLERARLGSQLGKDLCKRVGAMDHHNRPALPYGLAEKGRPCRQAVIRNPGTPAFGRGAPQSIRVVKEGRIADRPVKDRQIKRAKPIGDIAVANLDSFGHLVCQDVCPGESDRRLSAFDADEGRTGATGGDLEQHRADPAAGLDHAVRRAGRAGRSKEGGVHAGAIAARGLLDTHATIQKSILFNLLVHSARPCCKRREGIHSNQRHMWSLRLDPVTARAARASGSVDALVALGAADMAVIDGLIRERMQSDVEVIPALAEHLIAAGGKRLRPLVAVAAARLVGADGDAHQKLAAAVEFIHTATLLHDDIVDGSRTRRGKAAAHLIWGSAQSVLVGDFLFTRAFDLMVDAGSMPALRLLANASAVIAEGEVLQLTRAHDLNLPQEVYIQIIAAKTAALFSAAAESGALASGGTAEQVEAMRVYGENLGLAFQLSDDALDYGGASDALGKDAGDDFREGKATLPLLLAVQRTRGREEAFWARTVGKRDQTDDDFRRARELVIGTGALGSTLDLAGAYADTAKAALDRFEDGPWKTALLELADFAVSRST